MTQEQQKFYDIKTFRDYEVVGEDIDFIVLVSHETKEIILQYEESDSDKDWEHSLRFLPWLIKLDNKKVWTTRGYACAYSSAKNTPVDKFCEAALRYPTYKRIVRGWSFGSAMSVLSMIHIYLRIGQLDEVTTYGSVACLLNPFAKKKYYKCAKIIRNYCTPNDFVTYQVPFYHHLNKCKVGERFSLFKIFKTEFYHTHYEEYDYSKYEAC